MRKVEEDFIVLGSVNDVAGWNSYAYAATVYAGPSCEMWVAVGIMVSWETEMTYNVDDVRVTISWKL